MAKGASDAQFQKGMSKKGKEEFRKVDAKDDAKLAKKIKAKPGDRAKR
jgi:hypothetical protein